MFIAKPISAAKDAILINLKNYSMLVSFIKRDFKTRYMGSVLGGYWNFIHPIALILIYSVIFSGVMRVRFPEDLGNHPLGFTIYLCSGILPWTAFAEMLSRTTNIFHENANLIKKVYFPKEILLFVATGSIGLTFAISLAVLLAFLLVSGHGIGMSVLTLPLLLLMQVLFASGLGMILGIFNVFFTDVSHVLTIVLQVWFWLTPIVYRLEQIPQTLRIFAYLNPYYYLASLYQTVLYHKEMPTWSAMSVSFIIAAFFFALGAAMLAHFKDQISDEI